MLLFSKIYEFYCLYGIEILLSGATGAARQNSYEGLHIFSYEALFTTFYHFLDRCITFSNFFAILHIKLSYVYYLRGGDNGYFFVKLDFEIAVDQQTRTSDRTFEGVPDPNRQTVPAGQPRPYLVQIRPNLAKYPEHAQNPYFMCSTCS